MVFVISKNDDKIIVGFPIETVYAATFLAVKTDNQLTLKLHIKYIKKKL